MIFSQAKNLDKIISSNLSLRQLETWLLYSVFDFTEILSENVYLNRILDYTDYSKFLVCLK